MGSNPNIRVGGAEYRRKGRDSIRFRKSAALGEYPKACKVLDIGGLDRKLQHFLPSHVEYVAIDMTECDLNTEPLPFANQEFDYVFGLEVLEHLHRPVEGLREFARAGKKVIVSVPNPLYWQDVYRHITRWDKEPDWGHVNSFLYQNIALLCRKCGLTIASEATSTFVSWPMPFRLFSRHQIFLLVKSNPGQG